MAQDACPICDVAQPTTWMLTHLNPPATVLSCEEHIVINVITLLAIQLDMPAELLYDIIETNINGLSEVTDAAAEVSAAQDAVDDRSLNGEMYDDENEGELLSVEEDLEAAKRRHANATERVARKPRPRKKTQPRPEMDAEVTESAVEA